MHNEFEAHYKSIVEGREPPTTWISAAYSSSDPRCRAEGRVLLAAQAMIEGETRDGLRLLDEADAEWSRAASPPDIARWVASNARAVLLDDLECFEEALEAHQRALQLAQEIGYDDGVSISQCNTAFLHLTLGDATEAAFHTHAVLANKSAPLRARNAAHENLVMAAALGGSFDDAVRAQELNVQRQDGGYNAVVAYELLGQLQACAGDWAGVHRTIAKVEEIERITPVKGPMPSISMLKARSHIAEGRLDEARGLLDNDTLHEEPTSRSVLASTSLVEAEFAMASGRYRTALDHLQASPPQSLLQCPFWFKMRIDCYKALEDWQEALRVLREADQFRREHAIRTETLVRLADSPPSERDRQMLEQRLQSSLFAQLAADYIELHDIVIHELRGPLISAQYAVNLAAVQGARQLSLLLVAVGEVRRLIHMIDQVLDDGVQTSRDRLTAVGDIRDLIEAVIARFEPDLAAKGSAVVTAVEDVELVPLSSRPVIEVCLSNLLSNAVKYGPPGDRIVVGWEERRRSDDGELHMSEFTVSDGGPGISDPDIEQIFAWRGRSSADTTGGESSSGIGLAVVRRAARDVGGDLTFSPGPEGGSVMKLSFPAMRAPARPMRHSALSDSLRSEGGSRSDETVRLLLVDDKPQVVDVMAEVFRSQGSDVVAALSGSEAYRILRSGQAFELVVTDLMMEGAIAGDVVCRAAQTLLPAALVAVATGLSTETAARYVPSTVRILTKPLNLEEVAKLVSEAATRSAVTAPEAPSIRTGAPT